MMNLHDAEEIEKEIENEIKNETGPFVSLCANGDIYEYYIKSPKSKKIVHVIYKENGSNKVNEYKIGDILASSTKNPNNFYQIVDFELTKNGNIFKYERELKIEYTTVGTVMGSYMGDEIFSNLYKT